MAVGIGLCFREEVVDVAILGVIAGHGEENARRFPEYEGVREIVMIHVVADAVLPGVKVLAEVGCEQRLSKRVADVIPGFSEVEPEQLAIANTRFRRGRSLRKKGRCTEQRPDQDNRLSHRMSISQQSSAGKCY